LQTLVAAITDDSLAGVPRAPCFEGFEPVPVDGSTLRSLAHRGALAAEGTAEVFGDTPESRIPALLAALYAHDPATFRHSVETATLCREVGEALGLGDGDLVRLEIAALVHDIGKLLVPHRTLFKTSGLSPAEWKTVKRHPVTGANLLAGVPELDDVAQMVLHHHERPDGCGYPFGKRAGEFPLASGVIGVCDAYQAMTSERAYQRARTSSQALSEMEGLAGAQFDAEAVAGFARLRRAPALARVRRAPLVEIELPRWGSLLRPLRT
jgi:putative nucleotidyltransferase with HDIG domain